jgi:hypothetical protein
MTASGVDARMAASRCRPCRLPGQRGDEIDLSVREGVRPVEGQPEGAVEVVLEAQRQRHHRLQAPRHPRHVQHRTCPGQVLDDGTPFVARERQHPAVQSGHHFGRAARAVDLVSAGSGRRLHAGPRFVPQQHQPHAGGAGGAERAIQDGRQGFVQVQGAGYPLADLQ